MILVNATDASEHLNTLQSLATPHRQNSITENTNGFHPTVRPNNNKYE
jgi:hypothetical protein